MKTIDIHGDRVSPKRASITTADGEFEIGRAGSPLEYLLGSLAGCINVIGTLVAEDMDIDIRSLEIEVVGDIDARRYKGESEDPPAGFQQIRASVTVDADADTETLETWLDQVQDRCPVADNLRHGTDLTVELEAL